MPPTSTYKKKPAGITYEQIVRDVRDGNVHPVYYLMGDESYYIDRVADYIVQTLLTPEERDFDLVTYFGADVKIEQLITAARAYPMMARRLVILVKEAQNLKHLERFEAYFRQPGPATVLIFCHKNGTIDRRTKAATLIAKEGVLFESKRLYDRELPPFILSYLKRKGYAAAPGVAEMMGELIGADLNRLASELDKLIIALPEGEKLISTTLVEQSIAQTKNFSVFELQDALGQKDVLRANRIIKYFDANPKENPIQMFLPQLFKYFSNLMLAFYAPEKTEAGIAAWLEMTPWQVRRNVLPAMRSYTAMKTMQIIAEIRRTDARSKGVNNPATSNGELLKELLFFILH